MSVDSSQKHLNKLNRELDKLEKKLEKISEKEEAQKIKIRDIRRSIAIETSSSELQSKTNQILEYQNELFSITKKKEEINKKILEVKKQGSHPASVNNKEISTPSNPQESQYISGIDGVRSIAVIAVIFFHLTPGMMGGGYLGVAVFLVLSGYLITNRMMTEWNTTGRISVKQFYFRRIRRLYPALITVLLLCSAYITLFQRDLLYNLHQIVASSLLFVNNWWQIIKGFSYFDNFTTESPFTHIWFLSIEGQYFIIAPLLLLLLLRVTKNNKNITIFFLAASVISAIWMAILYEPGIDPTRVYYGTDTRIFSIWIGVALAIFLLGEGKKRKFSPKTLHWIDAAGFVSWIVIIISFVFMDAHYSLVYYGGIFGVSVFGAIAIAVIVVPGTLWGKLLSNPVFSWIGKRSYGIYLYQFPVMIFYEAKVINHNNHFIIHTIIKLCIIIAISELSFRFIETPLQNFDYKSFCKSFLKSTKSLFKTNRIQMALGTIVTGIAIVGLIIAPTIKVSEEQLHLEALLENNQKMLEERNSSIFKKNIPEIRMFIETADMNTRFERYKRDVKEYSSLMYTYGFTIAQLRQAKEMPLTVIGDSVILTVAPNLQEVFPKAIIDSAISRQTYEAPALIKELESNGSLKDTVLIGLGTNGLSSESVFLDIISALGNREIYWVNTHDPSANWQFPLNERLLKLESQFENLTVIDWYSYSNKHKEWYYSDLVHPNVLGSKEYVQLIGNSIIKEKSG